MFSQTLQNMLMSNGNSHTNSQFTFFDESRNDNANNNFMSQVGIHPAAVNSLWLSGLDEDPVRSPPQQSQQRNYESIKMSDYDSEDRKASATSISSYGSLSNDELFDIATSVSNNHESNNISSIDTNTTSPDTASTDDIEREIEETENLIKLENMRQLKAAQLPKNNSKTTKSTTKSTTKRRRKSSVSSATSSVSSSSSSSRVKKPMTATQRKAHNKIERKYRININSKIANLQKLVPWMSKENIAFEVESQSGGEYSPSDNDRGKKLNKSMILDIVTDYLVHLKVENRRQLKEIEQLKSQMK